MKADRGEGWRVFEILYWVAKPEFEKEMTEYYNRIYPKRANGAHSCGVDSGERACDEDDFTYRDEA